MVQISALTVAALLFLAALPSQQGAAARHELTHAERFHQVVVGAHLKTENAVGFGVAGTHHQDQGRSPTAAQASAQVEAIQARQHQIEHHQIEALAAEQLPGPLAIGCSGNGEALHDHGLADRLADGLVVLHHQQAGRGGRDVVGHGSILGAQACIARHKRSFARPCRAISSARPIDSG